MIDQSAIAIGPYPGKNMRRFLIGCRLLRAYYKCVFDTHVILVRVVRSIQILVLDTPLKTNILLKCSLTMFTYSDNTNYNLNFYYCIVSI
jgi:hypothetical protein